MKRRTNNNCNMKNNDGGYLEDWSIGISGLLALLGFLGCTIIGFIYCMAKLLTLIGYLWGLL